jgi:alkylation response protein AidB-like acyl-CoA dehydrogenase
MNFDLTPEQTSLQTRASTFARDVIGPVARRIDAENLFPRDLIASAGRARVIVAGGQTAVLRAALAAEALARGSATVALAISVNALVAQAIARFGDRSYADRTGQLEAGIAIGALALSVPPAASDAPIAPTAIDAGTLSGGKTWIANGEHADVALIVARRDGDAVTAIVDLRAGVARESVGQTAGARGLACANLTFTETPVPDAAVLRARDGVSPNAWILAAGRAVNAAVAIGVGRAGLDEALTATRARTEVGGWGSGVGKSEGTASKRAVPKKTGEMPQSVQFLLADMATELDAAWLLTLEAAAAIDEGRPAFEASMAGVQAVNAARQATDAALTVIGPPAMSSGARPERLVRDARAIQWFMGTPDAQRLTVAEAILR